MESLTAIQDKYISLLLEIPSSPGRYGNNTKQRTSLKKQFLAEIESIYPPEMQATLWQDIKDMASLLLISEENS